MTTPYAEWLATLGSLRVVLPACVRGQAVTHTLQYSGDMTSAALTGAIKAAPDATAELASFTIGEPVFADGKTSWTFGLGPGSPHWDAIPEDTDGAGVITLIFDLLLTPSGGTARRIAAGLFPVSGFVTEPA